MAATHRRSWVFSHRRGAAPAGKGPGQPAGQGADRSVARVALQVAALAGVAGARGVRVARGGAGGAEAGRRRRPGHGAQPAAARRGLRAIARRDGHARPASEDAVRPADVLAAVGGEAGGAGVRAGLARLAGAGAVSRVVGVGDDEADRAVGRRRPERRTSVDDCCDESTQRIGRELPVEGGVCGGVVVVWRRVAGSLVRRRRRDKCDRVHAGRVVAVGQGVRELSVRGALRCAQMQRDDATLSAAPSCRLFESGSHPRRGADPERVRRLELQGQRARDEVVPEVQPPEQRQVGQRGWDGA